MLSLCEEGPKKTGDQLFKMMYSCIGRSGGCPEDEKARCTESG